MEDLIKTRKRLVLVNFSSIADLESKNQQGLSGLQVAYRDTILEMFGRKGLDRYLENDFLYNKSIRDTLMYLASSSDKDISLHLKNYCDVCDTKIDLYSEVIDPLPVLIQEFTELNMYFLKKMAGRVYLNGRIWPKIYSGFKDFIKQLEASRIDLVVVSSCDEEFISEFFRIHKIEKPAIYTTHRVEFDPNLSWGSEIQPEVDLVAPAIKLWRSFRSELNPQYVRRNVIYIGRDNNLDLKMAQKAQIPFWLFTQGLDKIPEVNQNNFSNYGQLALALRKKKLFI